MAHKFNIGDLIDLGNDVSDWEKFSYNEHGDVIIVECVNVNSKYMCEKYKSVDTVNIIHIIDVDGNIVLLHDVGKCVRRSEREEYIVRGLRTNQLYSLRCVSERSSQNDVRASEEYSNERK